MLFCFSKKLNVTISVFDTTLFLNGGQSKPGFFIDNIIRMIVLSLSLVNVKVAFIPTGILFLYVVINGCFLGVVFHLPGLEKDNPSNMARGTGSEFIVMIVPFPSPLIILDDSYTPVRIRVIYIQSII